MCKYFLILTLTMLVISQTSTAFAATAITGTITEKRGDSVKVEFEPHMTVGPKIGEKVEFSTLVVGIKATAGTVKVTKVDRDVQDCDTSLSEMTVGRTENLKWPGPESPYF